MTKYKEDPEYLKEIQRNKCPYCQHQLQRPYPYKRQCSTCDWTHYGNPKYTAYKVAEPEISYTFNINFCVECSHELTYDRDTRELICPVCGLVHSGPPTPGVDYPFGSHTNTNFLLLR